MYPTLLRQVNFFGGLISLHLHLRLRGQITWTLCRMFVTGNTRVRVNNPLTTAKRAALKFPVVCPKNVGQILNARSVQAVAAFIG